MNIPSVLTGFYKTSFVFSKGISENVSSFYMFFVKLQNFPNIFRFLKGFSENGKCFYMAFVKCLEILWKLTSFHRDLVKTLIFSWCIWAFYKVCMKTILVLTWFLYKLVPMCIQGLHGNHNWIYMVFMKTKIG